MTTKMPRGAIPTPRSELAASEPYRPAAGAEIFVPSGEFPTPNHELAAAQPYKGGGTAPESFIAWPTGIGSWGNEKGSNSSWAEEAFAKACAEPKVFIPTDVVLFTSRECGAIANVGPVKIGVASANLASGPQGQVTPGTIGWAIYGLPTGRPENHCASLCGYGPLAALVDLFERHGVNVNLPSGMPTGLCYAMFTWGSIGIVDRQSLMNITGEAWVRNPTTIVKNLSG